MLTWPPPSPPLLQCVYYEACRQTDLACDTCDPVNPNRCTACHNSTTHTLFDGACVAVDACRARDLNCDGPCDTVNPNQCNSLACEFSHTLPSAVTPCACCPLR